MKKIYLTLALLAVLCFSCEEEGVINEWNGIFYIENESGVDITLEFTSEIPQEYSPLVKTTVIQNGNSDRWAIASSSPNYNTFSYMHNEELTIYFGKNTSVVLPPIDEMNWGIDPRDPRFSSNFTYRKSVPEKPQRNYFTFTEEYYQNALAQQQLK